MLSVCIDVESNCIVFEEPLRQKDYKNSRSSISRLLVFLLLLCTIVTYSMPQLEDPMDDKIELIWNRQLTRRVQLFAMNKSL